MTLLSVANLRVAFRSDQGDVVALDDISFDVREGEILGIVGESGSGKSVTALSIMRLLPMPPARILGGSISFDGEDLLACSESAMRRIRGKRIGMIFQEPMTSLNPILTIGEQIMESLRAHERMGRKDAQDRAVEMLSQVGIAQATRRLKDYPHQLSGGMRQRAMIAMALGTGPKLLIADEPTTALDVTIQQQILNLLLDLRDKLGMTLILITHNMGVVAEVSDRVLVMYAGKIIEQAAVGPLFSTPAHPYTKGLIRSIPSMTEDQDRLPAIPGTLPNPAAMPPGCRFAPRCGWRIDTCVAAEPALLDIGPGHHAACIRHQTVIHA